MGWFDRRVAPVLGWCAAAVLMGLMLLTCVDVGGRYLFNSPVWGAFELTEMMLAALIFAALPLVSLRNEHVTVDLFDPVTPDWLLRIQHAVACAIGFACMGYLAWRLWIRAGNLLAAGETTAQLKLTMAWLAYGMAVLMGLSALSMGILALRRPKRHHVE
jgi:TRAP-type C4-dicarboxylate transport system permease small subunit